MFHIQNIQRAYKPQSGKVGAVSLLTGGSYSSPPTAVVFSGGGGSGASASFTVSSSSSTVTSTGYITSLSAYSGLFSFMPNASSGQIGYITISGSGTGASAAPRFTGVVTGVNLTTALGVYDAYAPDPIVSFSGGQVSGGTPAQVKLILGPHTVNITGSIVNGGSGYSNPMLTISSTGGVIEPANVSLVVTNGVITGFNVVSLGQYFAQRDNGAGPATFTATVTDSTGSGAQLSAWAGTTLSKMVYGTALVNQGSGYDGVPSVSSISGSPYTAPVLAPMTSNNMALAYIGYTLNAGGTGYGTTSPATLTVGSTNVNLTAYGSGGTTTTVTTYSVASLTLTSQGSGYYAAPTITFTGGAGTAATAVASLV